VPAGLVGGIKGGLAVLGGAKPGAVIDLGGRESCQRRGVVAVVVVLNVRAKPVGGMADVVERAGPRGAVFGGPEERFDLGVVVAQARTDERLIDVVLAEHGPHRFGGHRCPVVAVRGPDLPIRAGDHALDQFPRDQLVLPVLDGPPHDLAGGQVNDPVEGVMHATECAGQERDVPTRHLAGRLGRQHRRRRIPPPAGPGPVAAGPVHRDALLPGNAVIRGQRGHAAALVEVLVERLGHTDRKDVGSLMAASGQYRWPSAGSSVAAYGQFGMAANIQRRWRL
jgi:hypothetical protein